MESEKPVIEKEYFGSFVKIYKTTGKEPYIFNFVIDGIDGVTHYYGGIPNYCETIRSALKRAWYRCKWMHDGVYNKKYSDIKP